MLKREALVRLRFPLRKKREYTAAGASEASPGKAVNTLPQYERYVMSKAEYAVYTLFGAAVLGVIAFVFYRHPLPVALFACIGASFPLIQKRVLLEKRKAQLQLQFKLWLGSLSSSLSAGKAVETAIRESLADMQLLYPDSRTLIIVELQILIRRLDNGETIEQALTSLSERAKLDDIRQFTDVFVICKRTGGNLVHVIRRTAQMIQEKLEIQQEIQVMLAQKRFESKVLSFAPIVMIAVLSFSSPDYMEPMYHGAGILMMTFALLMLTGCYLIARNIMKIKV